MKFLKTFSQLNKDEREYAINSMVNQLISSINDASLEGEEVIQDEDILDAFATAAAKSEDFNTPYFFIDYLRENKKVWEKLHEIATEMLTGTLFVCGNISVINIPDSVSNKHSPTNVLNTDKSVN